MEFWHYSDQNFTYDPNHKYVQGGHLWKPCGLWFSLGDEWETWCRAQEFQEEKLVTRSLVTINDLSNILIIEDTEQYQSFMDRFFFRTPKEPDWDALLPRDLEKEEFETCEKIIKILKDCWPSYKTTREASGRPWNASMDQRQQSPFLDLYDCIWKEYEQKKQKPRYGPDWEAVTKEYAGIIIPKYYELYRTLEQTYGGFFTLPRSWLSAWDVPSGCVWDLSIVTVGETVKIS